MKKIFTYKQFINEAMGVSPSFAFAKHLTELIVEVILEQYIENRNPEFDGELKLSSEDLNIKKDEFPIRNLKIGVTSTIFMPEAREETDFYVEGVFDGGSFEMHDDGTISFFIGVKLSAKFEDVLLISKKDENTIKKLKTEIESSVSHELTHAYEDYMRSKNKNIELSIHDTKEFLFDMVSNMLLKDMHFPKIIGQFLFNVYTSASYEVNARVAQSYSLVKDIKDPHKRWDIIKTSSLYKIADDLDTYDAQAQYDILYKNAKRELKTDEKVLEWMDSFIQLLKNTFLEGNNNLGRNAVSKVEHNMSLFNSKLEKKIDHEQKIVSIVLGHSNQVEKEIGKKDLLKFMKMWEKKFHKSGQNMKYRLGKITMLDID